MRKKSAGLLSLVVAAALGTTLGVPAVSATPATSAKNVGTVADKPDDAAGHELPNPLEEKRRALRQEAITNLLNGKGKVEKRGASTVMKVGTAKSAKSVRRNGAPAEAAASQDQYVELSREKTDKIFVVLADFGNTRHPDFPDKDLEPSIEGPKTFDGPANNQIPSPDRSTDNSTVWQPNYDPAHYQALYFGTGGAAGSGGPTESVRQYFERQSSGRYSIDGTVTNWVKVKYNEARYGRSSDNPTTNGDDPAVCSGNVCSNTWNLVQDAVNQWVVDQKAAGRSKASITKELKSFDQWDRYDADGDGNFNEPDGYLDHFQIVHAGGDEADGDPNQGEDAIWSHRWYVQTTPIGSGGPGGLGGTQIGDTGMWVGDYTMQPENGGMSVFAHEYTHDLGLPDLYDTNGGENSVNYWSLMAQSREAAPNDDAIGTRASDLGAWEKLQLGWLDYETVLPAQNRKLELGPHEYNSSKPQAAVVVLPKKSVTQQLVTPYAGTKSWWSGSGDDLNNTLSRDVTLGAGTSTLSMQAQWDIEDCGPDPCDYAYVEVNPGNGWVAVPGSITKADEGNGIDGKQTTWKAATFDLSAYAGKTVGLRLRYSTDGAAGGKGFFADDISLTSGGSTLFTSGAEASPEGWTLGGFSPAGASMTKAFDNYYIASHRDYVSFDKYLRSGPYNFGWASTRPDWVEHFPYQDGLLVSYWDTSQRDNNTSTHPGQGQILPVDANPRPLVRLDGALWRPRVGGYDAPFSLEKSDSITLHVDGQANYIRGQAAQPLFHDNAAYWDAAQPGASVKVPDTGTNIKVLSQNGTSMGIRIWKRN